MPKTTKSEVVKVRLPNLLKRTFSHVCDTQGKTASEVIRQLIVKFIIENSTE